VRPAIVAEKAGIPSVVIAATSFLTLAHELAEAEGMPDLRVAEYPGTLSVNTEAELRENLKNRTFSQIIEALIEPFDKSLVEPDIPDNQETSVFTGTLEEINEFFYIKKWSDGLAIIPPTKERTEEFLKYTSLAGDEDIAVLPPGNLRATPRIIAANAIMAGCRPEHMPILIAAVEAIADPHYDLEQMGTTTALNPFLIINGPIIRQLKLEYGTSLISRGPNTSIGRALGLIIRNIANLRPAEQNMGTFGYIIPFVLAEDEEDSPWEPFHVDQGFDKNTSTVTAGGTSNWGGQIHPSSTEIKGLLRLICRGIVKEVYLSGSARFGHQQMLTVVINPGVAKAIARSGYSKKAVEEHLFHNSRVPIEEVNFDLRYFHSSDFGTTIQESFEMGRDTPRDWIALEPHDTVPVMAYPGLIHIVVCGDLNRNKAMALHGLYSRPTTKEIKLPQNWDNLLAKRGYEIRTA
jgi:hypothetical protein